MRQKEVTILMEDGKFAKNSISIHYTGQEASWDVNQAVTEASNALDSMKARNIIEQPVSAVSKKLEKQFDKRLEQKQQEVAA